MNNLIIRGVDGTDKEAYALKKAKAMLCQNNKEKDCKCKSCSLSPEFHPDLLMVEPDGNSIKKEQADEMTRFVLDMPSVGSNRVVVVKDAQKMTDGAMNCLLKVLEEGPGKFIFITDERLISTVQSRCDEEYICDIYDGTDTFGLSPRAFLAATDLKAGVIKEFAKSDYFLKLNSLCSLFENIKNRNEVMLFFNELKEKDTNEFFTASSEREFVAMLKLMSAVFFGAAVPSCAILSDYTNVHTLYTELECLDISSECSSNIVQYRRGSYKKNDFFQFIKGLC